MFKIINFICYHITIYYNINPVNIQNIIQYINKFFMLNNVIYCRNNLSP